MSETAVQGRATAPASASGVRRKKRFKRYLLHAFLIVISLIYLTYVFSGVMSNPPWREVARQIAMPRIRLDKDYVLLFITMVGTTITPYMQFYLQSAVVDKGVRIDEYRYAKLDVYAGAFMTVFIAVFFRKNSGPATAISFCSASTPAASRLVPMRASRG